MPLSLPSSAAMKRIFRFDEVLRCLDLALRREGNVTVLQPQLAALDVRQDGNRTILLAHGAAVLHPRILRETDGAITYSFEGVGTALVGTRQINAGGLRSLQINTTRYGARSDRHS